MFVLGIAGGTGSGKTTVAEGLVAGAARGALIVVIDHDAYYRDRSGLTAAERLRINYDHPDSLETELLVEHLARLRAGRPSRSRSTTFASTCAAPRPAASSPPPVVIVEGILVLADERLRAQMDIKLFVDTDADIRLMRRLGATSSSAAAPSRRCASSTTRRCARCTSPSSSRRSASPI